MRIHETWREELGWLMIMFGFAGFEYGLINKVFVLDLPASTGATLMIMIVSAFVFFFGTGLHVTRPSRRLTDEPRAHPGSSHPGSHPASGRPMPHT